MDDVKVFILTHKKIEEKYDENLYFPLLNGSSSHEMDFGYQRDDDGENISDLNEYYAELTGQYWAWKNSKADIIGFCHYRRWFSRNIKFDKLTKNDIILDLKQNDIILPQKSQLNISVEKTIKKGLRDNPNYGAKFEDYMLLKKIIKNNFPEYYESFCEIMEGEFCYSNNMFITHRDIANNYFQWIFDVFNELFDKIDFSKYSPDNKRVFGFMSEILLTVFVNQHNFNVKEHYIYASERKFPLLQIFSRRFPTIGNIENKIYNKLI